MRQISLWRVNLKVLESKKPVIIFYREKLDNPDTEPFAVIKARRMTVETKDNELKGEINDFFTLMGAINYVSSPEGKSGRYVLCWFDDSIDDFKKSSRKLTGVTFPSGVSFTTSEDKRTYNASFQARNGKLD
jgi:hypothetical protein